MAKSDQAEGAALGVAPAGAPVSAFLKSAGTWIHGHSEVLSAMEAVMADWIERRHEAFDLWSRSLEKVCECREQVDFTRVQQDWLSDALRLTACAVCALSGNTVASTRKATAGVDRIVGTLADDVLERRRAKPETSGNRPVERIAAD